MYLLFVFFKTKQWWKLVKVFWVLVAFIPTFFVERDLALVHVYIYYITTLLLAATFLRIFLELKKMHNWPYGSIKNLISGWLLAGVLISVLPLVFWYS